MQYGASVFTEGALDPSAKQVEFFLLYGYSQPLSVIANCSCRLTTEHEIVDSREEFFENFSVTK
jgi:hypothetical protein